jgi:hypothetical protein
MGSRGFGPGKTIKIDWDEFDKLVSFQCTQEEIASFFDCSVDTLERAVLRERGVSLAELWQKRSFLGKIRLRKAQFAIVEKGGPGAATMAIYLDKKINPNENPDRPQPPISIFSTSNEEKKTEFRTFEEFCEVAGYPKPFVKQIEMQGFAFNDSDEPGLLLGSRGYGKTDYVTIMGVAYDLYLNGKNTANLIITKSKIRNTAIIEQIADALVANGVELSKRNAYCINVAGFESGKDETGPKSKKKKGKDYSVEAITIRSSFRGRHPKRILMDDPVTEEDVSAAQRALVERKYSEAYKLCKNITIIGQPAHAFDLYAKLRPALKRKLEVPWGTIPELDEDLDAMKIAGIDSTSIEMSYHLRVPVTGNNPFGALKFLDKFHNGDSVAFIDPSEGGDYTAVSIVKGYMNGVMVQGRAWKLPWYHCLDDMIKEFRLRGVRRICFETNKFGVQPLEQLRTVFGPMGIGVVGLNSDSNKHATIMNAGSFAHLIHLSKESDQVYTNQVVQYEFGAEFDDAPDSLARCLVWLGLVKPKK